MTDRQDGALIPQWNREQVSRHLLPVLREVDREHRDAMEQGADEEARLAVSAGPQAYAQLLRVWRRGSTEVLDEWFGHVLCDDELLGAAFDRIEELLEEQSDRGHASDISYDKQMYFAGLFRITNDQGKAVDLARPLEEYYLCDEAFYADHEYRRIELGDKCKAWIRHYLPYYNRIFAWYRENGREASGVGHDYVAYMKIYEYFRAQIAYEDGLSEQRQALEYERGGLGWFHRARKREIDGELAELALRELTVRLENATERYSAYEAQFAADREAWEDELSHAPLTAFARKRELKQKLTELEEKLEQFRIELGLDELQAEHRKMLKSKGK